MKAEISALVDAEIDREAEERVLGALGGDSELRQCWATYHEIGDALRRVPSLSPDFTSRVLARLDDEPTVFAPVPPRERKRSPLRIALPLAASVMGVAAVAWVAQSVTAPQPAQVAALPAAPQAAPVVAASAPQAMAAKPAIAALARSDQVTQYLIAHHGYSPSMSGVANYVRSVSETRSGEAR